MAQKAWQIPVYFCKIVYSLSNSKAVIPPLFNLELPNDNVEGEAIANYIIPLIVMMERMLWGSLTFLTKSLFPHGGENNAPDLLLSLSSLSPSVCFCCCCCFGLVGGDLGTTYKNNKASP